MKKLLFVAYALCLSNIDASENDKKNKSEKISAVETQDEIVKELGVRYFYACLSQVNNLAWLLSPSGSSGLYQMIKTYVQQVNYQAPILKTIIEEGEKLTISESTIKISSLTYYNQRVKDNALLGRINPPAPHLRTAWAIYYSSDDFNTEARTAGVISLRQTLVGNIVRDEAEEDQTIL